MFFQFLVKCLSAPRKVFRQILHIHVQSKYLTFKQELDVRYYQMNQTYIIN